MLADLFIAHPKICQFLRMWILWYALVHNVSRYTCPTSRISKYTVELETPEFYFSEIIKFIHWPCADKPSTTITVMLGGSISITRLSANLHEYPKFWKPVFCLDNEILEAHEQLYCKIKTIETNVVFMLLSFYFQTTTPLWFWFETPCLFQITFRTFIISGF